MCILLEGLKGLYCRVITSGIWNLASTRLLAFEYKGLLPCSKYQGEPVILQERAIMVTVISC